MALLVNQSFFIRDISIPNTGNEKILERLNSFISQREPECLLKILGYPLFKEFGTENSLRMTALLSGAEYTGFDGVLTKWKGLVHDTNISLLAYYIYYFFQESSATHTTGVSTSVSKTEAGVSVSPADKMISAWNLFADEVTELSAFLVIAKDLNGIRVYPEFTTHQFYKVRQDFRRNNFIGL